MRIESSNKSDVHFKPAGYVGHTPDFQEILETHKAASKYLSKYRKRESDEEELRSILAEIKFMPHGKARELLMDELRSAVSGLGYISNGTAAISRELGSIEHDALSSAEEPANLPPHSNNQTPG